MSDITDMNDIDMSKEIQSWLLSDEWHRFGEYKLSELDSEQQQEVLDTWKTKLDLLRNVISASMHEMAIQINDVMLELASEKENEEWGDKCRDTMTDEQNVSLEAR